MQQRFSVKRLRGARVRPDMVPSQQGMEYASFAYNVDYANGTVTTRRPFKRLATVSSAPYLLQEWFGPGFRRWVMPTAAELRIRDLPGNTEYVVASRSGGTPLLAAEGSRMVVGEFTRSVIAPGLPVGALPSILLTNTGSVAGSALDAMWPTAPAGSVWNGLVGSSAGPEVITPGIHQVAGVFITRSGYRSRPVPLGTFVAGTGLGAVTIRTTFPIGISSQWLYFQYAIAPVDTPASLYVVPDGFNRFTVTGGGTAQYTFMLDDATLQQTGEELNPNNLPFVQGTPFNIAPYAINRVGNRYAYHADIPTGYLSSMEGAVFFSDPGEPQSLRISNSIVQTPKRAPVTAGMEIDGVYYMLGMDSTHAIQPTADFPLEWAPAQEVSGEIGALFQTAVLSSGKRREGYVATIGGAYVLAGGRYLSRPLSYWAETDWKRINWATAPAHAFQWIDDADQNRIGFSAPLDGALQATHVFWWTYQARGRDGDYMVNADNVDYALMPWPDMVADGGYGEAAAVGRILGTNLKSELCYVPGNPIDGAYRIYRQDLTDAPYPWKDDEKWEVESIWASGAFGGESGAWVASRASLEVSTPLAAEGNLPEPQLWGTILSETPNRDNIAEEIPLGMSRAEGETVEHMQTARGAGLYFRLRGRTPWNLAGLSLWAWLQSGRR